MKLYFSVKQAGRRKEYITRKELVLSNAPATLRELLTEIIRRNVEDYNRKTAEPWTLEYLTPEALENQALTGKVGFGELKNSQKADYHKALEAAVLAFEDGIYRVFKGENEIPALDEQIDLEEGDVLTFIRLTMLAGRMW